MHTQNSLTAPVYEAAANSKAVIKSKQDKTGLEEEELVAPKTVIVLSERDKLPASRRRRGG